MYMAEKSGLAASVFYPSIVHVCVCEHRYARANARMCTCLCVHVFLNARVLFLKFYSYKSSVLPIGVKIIGQGFPSGRWRFVGWHRLLDCQSSWRHKHHKTFMFLLLLIELAYITQKWRWGCLCFTSLASWPLARHVQCLGSCHGNSAQFPDTPLLRMMLTSRLRVLWDWIPPTSTESPRSLGLVPELVFFKILNRVKKNHVWLSTWEGT